MGPALGLKVRCNFQAPGFAQGHVKNILTVSSANKTHVAVFGQLQLLVGDWILSCKLDASFFLQLASFAKSALAHAVQHLRQTAGLLCLHLRANHVDLRHIDGRQLRTWHACQLHSARFDLRKCCHAVALLVRLAKLYQALGQRSASQQAACLACSGGSGLKLTSLHSRPRAGDLGLDLRIVQH